MNQTIKFATNPEVGLGATICHFSDRTACTIVSVTRFKSGTRAGQVRQFEMQRDIATRTDGNGMSDAQRYRYERDPNGVHFTARPTKDGFRVGSSPVVVGYREEYFDYSF